MVGKSISRYQALYWVLDRLWYWVVTVLFVGSVLLIGSIALLVLRFYCVIWQGRHTMGVFPGNDFDPGTAECRICGKVDKSLLVISDEP